MYCTLTTDFSRWTMQNPLCVLSIKKRMGLCHIYFLIAALLNNFGKKLQAWVRGCLTLPVLGVWNTKKTTCKPCGPSL